MGFKPKILDRYIAREVMAPFVVAIVGFVLIMLIDLIFTFTDLIINKGVPASAVLKLLVFKLPAILVLTFPVSTLFGTMMALGRLSGDNEIVALRTSGVSLLRVALPLLVLSLTISFCSYLTNEFLVPASNAVSEDIIRQMILKKPTVEIRENVFFKDKGNRYFYVRQVDPKTATMTDIMIYELTGEDLPRVTIAKRATFNNFSWDLEDGVIHNFGKDGHLEYEASFDKMQIIVTEDFLGYLGYSDDKTTQDMSSHELIKLISMLRKGGVNTRSLLVDLYMKYSIPLTCFVFALIGIPLALPSIRAGRAFGVVTCIAIVFTFYVFASISRSFGYGGIVIPAVAAFTPQATFLLLGSFLFFREALTR